MSMLVKQSSRSKANSQSSRLHERPINQSHEKQSSRRYPHYFWLQYMRLIASITSRRQRQARRSARNLFLLPAGLKMIKRRVFAPAVTHSHIVSECIALILFAAPFPPLCSTRKTNIKSNKY